MDALRHLTAPTTRAASTWLSCITAAYIVLRKAPLNRMPVGIYTDEGCTYSRNPVIRSVTRSVITGIPLQSFPASVLLFQYFCLPSEPHARVFPFQASLSAWPSHPSNIVPCQGRHWCANQAYKITSQQPEPTTTQYGKPFLTVSIIFRLFPAVSAVISYCRISVGRFISCPLRSALSQLTIVPIDSTPALSCLCRFLPIPVVWILPVPLLLTSISLLFPIFLSLPFLPFQSLPHIPNT